MCYQKIKNALQTHLKDNGILPKEELIKIIPIFEHLNKCKLTEKEKNELIENILYENQYYITIDAEINKNGYQEWLPDWEKKQKEKRVNDYFYYSDRYEEYLLKEQGFPPRIVKNISEINKKILNYLPNSEKTGEWITKGLVMGYVQSGKTANYISLINRAADVGYKFIILIAGVHNNLRSQTQQRINEGFIGFDSLQKKIVGVGKINARRRPHTLTTVNEDFKKNLVGHFGFSPNDFKEPVILVIKKNSSTLKYLIEWLKTAKPKGPDADYPLLLIDDEADNASINTSTEENPTTINARIREILNMFNRRVYIGYTATPFANIFIDNQAEHEDKGVDLFPDDFIITLNAPENYIGAKTIFLDKKFQGKNYEIIRHIEDNEPCIPAKPKKDFELECLPDSLKKAIRLFVLASVIKAERDEKLKYTTMLINVTFKKYLHYRLQHLVDEELEKILNGVYARDKEVLTELKELYLKEYVYNNYTNDYTPSPETFDNYIEKIAENIDKFKVVTVNSDSKGLDYNEYPGGVFVIAIGGYSLSRGFTLEGLTISYFIRTTKMYDTLLQMGRWFGYRNKYEDLCRIYMPKEIEVWYQHIAEVVEELKYDLKELQLSKRPPKDYGLKIRTHPESLLITARNKMHNTGEILDYMDVCYSRQLIETRLISADTNDIKTNFELFNEYIKDLSKHYSHIVNKNNFLFKNIPYEKIIEILSKLRNNMTMKTFMEPEGFKDSIIEYILKGSDFELSKWDIAVKSINSNRKENIGGIKIGITKRGVLEESGFYLLSGRKYRLGDSLDEAIGLNVKEIKEKYLIKQIKDLKDEGLSENEIERKIKNLIPPGQYIRTYRKKPLLIFYILDLYKDSVKKGELIEKNVTAYAISFPETQNNICSDERIAKYKVNKVFIRELEKERKEYGEE